MLFRLHFGNPCHRPFKFFPIAALGALVKILFGNECREFLSQSQRNQLVDRDTFMFSQFADLFVQRVG